MKGDWRALPAIALTVLLVAVISVAIFVSVTHDGPDYLDASEPNRIRHVCEDHEGTRNVSTDGFDAAVLCNDGAYATVESGWDSEVVRFPVAKK